MPEADGPARYNGILNVAKATGMTSHDVVSCVRRMTHQRRVGHAGTLDPAAEGVLLVCLGRATRVSDQLMEGTKVYRGTVRFGVTSTTDDREGTIQPVPLPSSLGQAEIETAALSFVGDIEQIPPAFAAIKVAGQTLYRRARAGEVVDVPARRVRIFRLDVRSWQPPDAVIEVICSKGTYIRAIARDLGLALGTGAHLVALCRLASGRYMLEDSVSLDEIDRAAASGYLDRLLYPPDEAVSQRRWAVLSDAEADRVANGGPWLGSPGPAYADAETIRAYRENGQLLALLSFRGDQERWYPDKVFPTGEVDGVA